MKLLGNFTIWRAVVDWCLKANPARPSHPGHSTILLRSETRAACAHSVTLRQQATIEIMRRYHSIIACSCQGYMLLFFAHIRSWWITHSTQRHRRGCNIRNLWWKLQNLPCLQRLKTSLTSRKIKLFIFSFATKTFLQIWSSAVNRFEVIKNTF